MPQPEKIQQLLAAGRAVAEGFLRDNGKVPPMMLAFSDDGMILHSATSTTHPQVKDDFAGACRLLARANRSTAVVLILEAWARIAPPGGSIDTDIRPSTAPDRIEIISLNAEIPGHGYDAGKDRPQSVIAAKGTAEQSTTTYAYTSSGAAIGRVSSITDGDGLVTTKTYDSYGQPDITTAPGGFATNENYSERGNLDSIVTPNGRTTAYSYNQRRQVTGELADQSGIAAATDTGIDNQARVSTVTGPADNGGQRPQESRTYSPTDKVRLKKLNGTTVAETSYDSRDWAASAKDAANRTTTFGRKSNGDIAAAQRPGARTTTFAYDGDSRVVSSSNPGANTGTRTEGFAYSTSAGGPRTIKTEADGLTVRSDFDRQGRLRFLQNRKGATFEFRYDSLGRRTHVITPQGSATVTSYKKNGRVASVTEPSGDSATFNYNATTGRLSSVAYSGSGGGTVNYTSYDSNGNVLALNENGDGGISRTYDGLNRVTSYTAGGQTIGYRYYASGKLAKLIYPGGSESGTGHVEYTYNANGRLKDVIDRLDSTTRTTSYSWNTDGRLQSITRPNGTLRTISYDSAGRPNGITDAGLAWSLDYWPSDDVKSIDVTPAIPPNQYGELAAVPKATMTFDSANQLATYNGQGVTHDMDGNMLSGPLPGGAFASFSYDSRNRLTSAGTTAYTYNAESNRIGIAGPSETTSFIVDPEGALPKVLSRTKSGVTTRYVYGAGLQYEVSSAGGATYYHYDQTGNTAALTNQAGVMIDRMAYSPYGTIRYRQASFDTPFLYAGFFGVMTDANGLVSMRARCYNPATMRFINSDPARDGLNWYAYASGNPVNFSDPTGLLTVTVNSATPDIPFGNAAAAIGKQHQWITTDTGYSSGMGNAQGVPGENGQNSPDLPYSSTMVVDHTGRISQSQRNVSGIDMDALASYLQPGLKTGPWIPLFNDCNTYVDTAIQKSTPHYQGRPASRNPVVVYADGTARAPSQNISTITPSFTIPKPSYTPAIVGRK
jgi:RHS repeat-associated protein